MKKTNNNNGWFFAGAILLVGLFLVLSDSGSNFGGATPTAPFNSSSTIATSSPTLVLADNTARRGIILSNDGSNTVYLSLKATSTGVTTETGIRLGAGLTISLEPDKNGELWKGQIWGIALSGTSSLTISEQ